VRERTSLVQFSSVAALPGDALSRVFDPAPFPSSGSGEAINKEMVAQITEYGFMVAAR